MIKTICFKDLKLFFSDKKSVIITFLLPIVLITLFAFAFGGISSENSNSKKTPLLVSDLDQTVASKALLVSLKKIKGLSIIEMPIDQAENSIRKGKKLAVLIIKNGFEVATTKGEPVPLELKYDRSREIEIGMLQALLMQSLMRDLSKKNISTNIDKFIAKEFGGLPDNVKSDIKQKVSKNDLTSDNNVIDFKLTAISKPTQKQTNIGLIQAVSGTAIMMLLFSIAEIGGGLLDEKEGGTLKRLLYAPIKPKTILFGKMSAALIIAILQLIVMLCFAYLTFGLPIFDNLLPLIVLIIAIAFAIASFGMLLVSVAKTRKQLSGLSSMLILTMSAIGGSMIPLFAMPAIMQKIAIISVNYWGIQGFYDIFARGLSFVEILPRIVVLLGIGLLFTFIAMRMFQKNLFKLI